MSATRTQHKKPTNPHPKNTSRAEAWDDGYDGRPMQMCAVGSAYDRAYRQGEQAATQEAETPPTSTRCIGRLTQKHVDYVLQYGGHCRECADWNGVCPSSGLPCGESERAVQYVVDALNYGFKHGYISTEEEK